MHAPSLPVARPVCPASAVNTGSNQVSSQLDRTENTRRWAPVAVRRPLRTRTRLQATIEPVSRPQQLRQAPIQASEEQPAGVQLWKEQITGNTSSLGPTIRTEKQLSALGNNPWEAEVNHLSKKQLWKVVLREARLTMREEPALASLISQTIHPTLEHSMAFLLANKLANEALLSMQLLQFFMEAYSDPRVADDCAADLQAVFDRDPACERYLQCLLFFKGFQAIQAQRVAHWIWRRGRRALAIALQNRMSEVFGVDMHPAATLGRGIMMDHATGIVIGETAVVGDNVSMLHHVTLGGSGTGSGTRHPTIGNGVLLGAGVSVLGPIVVGHSSKVGAGSVVISDIPPNCVAVGVPARVVKQLDEKLDRMDQGLDYILDYEI